MSAHRCRWHREDDDYSEAFGSHFSGILPGARRRRPLCHSHFFPNAQGDAISNETFRAKTAHAAVGYRVASLRNTHMALAAKRKECERSWNPKILVVQDEVSLFPAIVENMLLYRSMRSRQNEYQLRPESYGDEN